MKEVLNEIFSTGNKMRNMAIIVVCAFIIGLSASYLFQGPEDGPIETLAEKVIESETGVHVDFDEIIGN